jgi:aspartate aminotransferase-like enzyme
VEGILLTHCETSTGSLTDIRAICEAVSDLGERQGRRFLTCVDCITSLCIDEFRMDEWRVDCAVGASQKGFLSPPGLAFVCAGEEARKRMAGRARPGYYFDLGRYFDDPVRPPFTPAVQVVCAVRDSIESILGLGLPSIWNASRATATALRLIAKTAGFRPVAASQAGGVVAFRVDGLDPESLAAALSDRYGIVVAQGQGDLRGKILRVSTIGKGPAEIRRFAEAFESVLAGVGRSLCLQGIESELERLLKDGAIWE